jgi:hypothetical protein
MTTMNTFPDQRPTMNRASRSAGKTDTLVGGRARASGLGRKIGAFMLRASLAMLAMAAILALQAAFYVYAWRLPG